MKFSELWEALQTRRFSYWSTLCELQCDAWCSCCPAGGLSRWRSSPCWSTTPPMPTAILNTNISLRAFWVKIVIATLFLIWNLVLRSMNCRIWDFYLKNLTENDHYDLGIWNRGVFNFLTTCTAFWNCAVRFFVRFFFSQVIWHSHNIFNLSHIVLTISHACRAFWTLSWFSYLTAGLLFSHNLDWSIAHDLTFSHSIQTFCSDTNFYFRSLHNILYHYFFLQIFGFGFFPPA